MDTLHTVLRSIQNETQVETKTGTAKPDHLTVFREFLARLDEIQRKARTSVAANPAVKKPRAKSTRRKTKRAKA